MSRPRVSVLMPSYNHAAYVKEAALSALRAADEAAVSMELVVVDDGSRDDSVEILERLEEPRLRLEVQENAGAHAAFNRLLEMARGDVLFLLNSDDLFAPERIARCLERLDQAPEMIAVGSWLEVIDAQGSCLGIKQAWHTMPPWPRPTRGPSLAALGEPGLALLETNFLATTSNLAFRRSALDRGLRFLPLRYCHDWDFFLGLCHLGGLVILEQPLVRYRVHAENTLKETEDAARGQAAMHFEILWLLARHASRLCQQMGGRPGEDVGSRLWSSLPRFGAEALLGQLLAWRGDDVDVPGSYDRLLEPAHPFRLQAEAALREAAS